MKRIKFKEEKQSYRIMAEDENYAICTKPFNARKTYLYTIVDFNEGYRNKDNYIWPKFDYSDAEECRQALAELNSGEMGISWRGRIKANIEWIKEVSDV